MKEVVIIDQEKWNKMPITLGEVFHEISKKGFGCKLVSNETGKEYDSLEAKVGHFALIWDKVKKKLEEEV